MNQKKLIVTHTGPDLDAVASVWILKKFDEEHFGEARLGFVGAGEVITQKRLTEMGINEDEVVHVDTGLGEFDHHQQDRRDATCAAALVAGFVHKIHPDLENDMALNRMVEHFVDIDNFGDYFWPEPNHDRYLFNLDHILSGLKTTGAYDEEVVSFGCRALEAVYAEFGEQIAAEREVVKEGIEFESKWGKALGVKTSNDAVIKYAQKAGFNVVIRKDPVKGNVRIKAVPGKNIDLTEIYEKIRILDPNATWYLHPAKTMLLNGSGKASGQIPSFLGLEKVINLLKTEAG